MTDTLNRDRYFPDRQAGRRGARESHEPRLLATLFKVPGPSNAYVEWDGTHGIRDFGLDGNDAWGDCGAAAVDHGNMAKAGNAALLNTLGQPKYAGTLPTYWAYGLSQGETGTAPNPPDEPDEGVDNASWLAFLYANGIIDGYGEVPVDQMDNYAPEATGLLVGQNLPASAESDFEAHPPIPWGSPGEVPDGNEGHDTWYAAGHVDGSGELITWGGLQPFTVEYRQRFITDAWIIFDKDDPSVDWTALQAALDAVHGVVQPLAAAPPPPSPPSPVRPAPGPQGAPG